MYDALTDTLTAYDGEILRQLDAMSRADSPNDCCRRSIARKSKELKARGEDPLRRALYRMSGWTSPRSTPSGSRRCRVWS